MNKTYIAKKEDIKRRWYIVDAKDKILGRLAARVAVILRGKHKPIFTPSMAMILSPTCKPAAFAP